MDFQLSSFSYLGHISFRFDSGKSQDLEEWKRPTHQHSGGCAFFSILSIPSRMSIAVGECDDPLDVSSSNGINFLYLLSTQLRSSKYQIWMTGFHARFRWMLAFLICSESGLIRCNKFFAQNGNVEMKKFSSFAGVGAIHAELRMHRNEVEWNIFTKPFCWSSFWIIQSGVSLGERRVRTLRALKPTNKYISPASSNSAAPAPKLRF